MRRFVAILTFSLCIGNTALGGQDEFVPENNRTRPSSSPTPIVFSFRGGLVGALNFDWYQPTGEQARGRFSLAGLAIEAHNPSNLVVGLGADFSWNTWTRDDDVEYYGRAMQRLSAIYLYGTLGRTLWQNPAASARSWCSVDIGWMSCNESPNYVSTATLEGDFAGTAVRVRASYLHHVTRTVALGVTGGWQWAEPTLQRRYSYNKDRLPRLKLSGPMIAASLSLVSPLGK